MAPVLPDSFQKLTLTSGATDRWEDAIWNLIDIHFPRVGRHDVPPVGAMLLLAKRKGYVASEAVNGVIYTAVARETGALAALSG